MPATIFDEKPRRHRLDPKTDLVYFEQPMADGRFHDVAMPYPLFCEASFEALAFIEQTNKARERAAGAPAPSRVIPLRKGGKS